ncbi:tRNA 5-methoxyuridine(34)/uridine 5-oxyacetic acid(34) synthase CmoB [Pseudobacteriovorax antillogorgiicola]|uniref:tRNA (Mo5U34)-methyltransferase n=1 Tax=Pseudobacteriovorax antillogorgiicola TaxID=1513793 RepID=A0A1Y6CLU2_9BACT|nr:tRNA 5-methoxyuridine(34)/uridine 5-oxyacetic acid(34) synthase CmoB [Pseudobacteriovorax antillogorgiicola]TCS45020.1 tRNA (mo5U34)-methyltransferase [Pseudobacteriovorax antillogorgiicola]SMF76327.1 tRNA (mo5U34)-methyltransferase [Pseudobacteriovorax antillogorgiicola]
MTNIPWLPLVSSDHADRIQELRDERMAQLEEPRFAPYRKALEQAPAIDPNSWTFDEATVGFHLDSQRMIPQEQLEESLKAFIPWKKGPFNLFGTQIDSEWRSDLKWQRLQPAIGSLEDHVVADIGCHNGYFMFRMVPERPKAVIGFEPVAKHWFNFQLLNRYAQQSHLYFELFGVEHMDLFPKSFDTIFCLGILYHHTDPIGLLRKMRESLRKRGQLFIDCQGIAGDEPVAFVPPGKYAGARGIWFLPTLSCLENWVRRAGFQKIEVIFSEQLSTDEQRSSPWAPINSLAQSLSPCGTKTIEGHPAPYRFYLKAKI